MAGRKDRLGTTRQRVYDPLAIEFATLLAGKEIANMKCRMLVLLLAGSALFQLGCGSGSGGGGASVATCSGTFNACGGDLTGKWAIDGVCVEGDIKTLISQEVEGMPTECNDLIKGVSIDMSGTVEFANGTQTSDVTTAMEMKFKYTSACASALSGMPITMDANLCSVLAESANKQDEEETDKKTSATCSFSGGTCNCTMSSSGRDQSSTTYAVSGNTFSTGDGDIEEYCVSGKNLTVRDKSSADVAGQTKLHRI
jgi:hypothetical protein